MSFDSLYLPVTDRREIHRLLSGLPLAIDRAHFLDFVAGFPLRYFVSTPAMEIVKHYLLLENLDSSGVISSLAREREEGLWKLCLITRDQPCLFARIAGTLSCFGAKIVSGEAFANAHAVVLDTFRFSDPENRFLQLSARQKFQQLLEDAIVSRQDLTPLLASHWPKSSSLPEPDFQVEIDNDSHPSNTRLSVRCRDHFGLLYLLSRSISDQGCSIDIAQISTEGSQVHDEFYLTHRGAKLAPSMQRRLAGKLAELPRHHFDLNQLLTTALTGDKHDSKRQNEKLPGGQ
ncbi:MAG: hypothetical protein ACRD1R_09850 [Acidobacteriota bacterium]